MPPHIEIGGIGRKYNDLGFFENMVLSNYLIHKSGIVAES